MMIERMEKHSMISKMIRQLIHDRTFISIQEGQIGKLSVNKEYKSIENYESKLMTKQWLSTNHVLKEAN